VTGGFSAAAGSGAFPEQLKYPKAAASTKMRTDF
jgi:hypothetical protein